MHSCENSSIRKVAHNADKSTANSYSKHNFHQLAIIIKENHDNLVGCNEPTTNNSRVSRVQINMPIFS